MKYTIEVTEDAKHDLSFFAARERKIILQGIRERLSYEPLQETRNQKVLRKNPIAPWELRIGKYRVFYEVRETVVTVGVVAVGYKEHNALYIRGKQVSL